MKKVLHFSAQYFRQFLVFAPIIIGALFVMPSVAHGATVNVSGTISSNTTWVNTNVYVVDAGLSISNGVTLTVEEGTVVKLLSDVMLDINGSLVVSGTSVDKVYFTSIKDDAVGGDTNSDGSATSPDVGDWGSLKIMSGGYAQVEHAVIRYGGGSASGGNANIFVDGQLGGGELVLSNSEVSHAEEYGIRHANGSAGLSQVSHSEIHDNGTSGVYIEKGDLYMDGSSVYDHDMFGVYISSGGVLDLDGNDFSDNMEGAVNTGMTTQFTHSGNTSTGPNSGFVMDGSLKGDTTLDGCIDLPFIINGVSVPYGNTLTIQPGTVLKMKGSIGVLGSLVADGTVASKIYFTSYKDDSVCGDANGDSTTTSPARGDWSDISVNYSGYALIDHAVIRYGGSANRTILIAGQFSSYPGGDLDMSNTEVTMSKTYGIWLANGTSGGVADILNSNIHDNEEIGIYVQTGDLYLTSSTVSDHTNLGVFMTSGGVLDLDSNHFSDNANGAVNTGKTTQFSHIGNTSSGPNSGFVLDGPMQGNMILDACTDLPFIVEGLGIQSGTTLTIEAGAVLKMKGGMSVLGDLVIDGTSMDKVYITSYKDDSACGDTNGDGSTTTPSRGDWGDIGIKYSGDATIDHAVIRYGGSAYSVVNVDGQFSGGELVMTNSEITESNKSGIHQVLGSNGSIDISDSEIHSNSENGIKMETGVATIVDSGIYDNDEMGIYNTTSTVVSAEHNWWGHASGPYNYYYYTFGSGDEVSGYPPTVGKNVNADNWLTSW